MNTFILAVLLIGQVADKECPDGKCLTKGSNHYEWRDVPADDNQAALFRDNKQIGVLLYSTGDYYRMEGSAFTKVPLPAGINRPQHRKADFVGPPAPSQDMPNYGIDLDKINRSRTYSLNGHLSSRDDAHEALQGKLTDDSTKLRVTVIGTPADCDKVQRDVDSHTAFKELRSRIHVKCYGPDNPMVDVGFKKDGAPVIYCQDPNGKVLHRQDEYTGPEQLAEAVRRADPKYTPANDPNVMTDPVSQLKKVPIGLWVIGGAIAVLLLTRKQATTRTN